MCQKRRKNVITRFEEHSSNKFHGKSFVYIHETCATTVMEKYNAISEQMHTRFWWESLTERDRLANTGVDGRIILKCI
jgi:hypothetical protein